jgi:hypothetical protein
MNGGHIRQHGRKDDSYALKMSETEAMRHRRRQGQPEDHDLNVLHHQAKNSF